MIQRGYERRCRHLWGTTRWQTFYLMSAQVGSDNLKKSGIYKPTDLIKFPWENDSNTQASPLTDEERQELIDLMAAHNAH